MVFAREQMRQVQCDRQSALEKPALMVMSRNREATVTESMRMLLALAACRVTPAFAMGVAHVCEHKGLASSSAFLQHAQWFVSFQQQMRHLLGLNAPKMRRLDVVYCSQYKPFDGCWSPFPSLLGALRIGPSFCWCPRV